MNEVVERNQLLIALFSNKHYKRAFCPVSVSDLQDLLGYAEGWQNQHEIQNGIEERAYQLVADGKLTGEEMIALIAGGDEFRKTTARLGFDLWTSRKAFEDLPAESVEDIEAFRAKVAELSEEAKRLGL